MTRPLLVSDDTVLVDDILRFSAAANVEVHLATDVESARGLWSTAPLVLVGADLAARVAGLRVERRRDVVLVGRDIAEADWQRAVTIGAEHVASLPDSERWLITRLADSGESAPRSGTVLAVMSGGGGAGASTLAVALGAAAAAESKVLLVDLDPLAGGIDVIAGVEGVGGARWRDLIDTQGRLSPATLEASLPAWAGMSVLSWGREGPSRLGSEALASVLDAGERGFDFVILDIPRVLDEVTELALGRARHTIVVTSASVRGAAAAARLSSALRDRCAGLGIVIRNDRRGLRPAAIASVLDGLVLGELPYAVRMARRCEAGDGPLQADAYGRSVRELLRTLQGDGRARG